MDIELIAYCMSVLIYNNAKKTKIHKWNLKIELTASYMRQSVLYEVSKWNGLLMEWLCKQDSLHGIKIHDHMQVASYKWIVLILYTQ